MGLSAVTETEVNEGASQSSPVVQGAVVTIVYRRRAGSGASGVLGCEFLVSRQLRGSRSGEIQIHLGGHLEPDDHDAASGAARELREELGFDAGDLLQFIGVMGPSVYHSRLRMGKSTLTLEILDGKLAWPKHFLTCLFACDVSGLRRTSPCDGEIQELGWMTLKEIVSIYGNHPSSPRFQGLFALVQCLSHLHSEPCALPSVPGVYTMQL